MSGHERTADYISAMGQFEKHLRRSDDGTLELDTDDIRSIGVSDPVIFADLKRSLEVTNQKIRAGEISIDDVTNYIP
jgi:hypothetical protein